VNRNILLSVFLTSTLTSIGTAPFAISYFMRFFVETSLPFEIYKVVARYCLYIMHGVHFFIFYYFNKAFKQIFKSIINHDQFWK
jgi:hypothetical protein